MLITNLIICNTNFLRYVTVTSGKILSSDGISKTHFEKEEL